MAKNERVKIYNKGTRTWPLADGKDKDNKPVMVECSPGRSIELNKIQADNLVKNYPNDFLAGEPVVKVNDNKKLKAEVKRLTADNEKLVAEIAVLGGKVAEFEAEAKDAKKPQKDWS